MVDNTAIITSINNVRHTINNAILMLRDLDTALSKKGFKPLNGNWLGAETSKSINQSMVDYRTFFPQYISRQYALENEIDKNVVKKILFVNIQFFHGDYIDLPPTFISSVMIFPTFNKNLKASIDNWWLKYIVYEETKWEKVIKNGGINENIDDDKIRTIYWCYDLLSFNKQSVINKEVDKLLELYYAN
ncbi:hypothetical protein [Mesobacillus jeotgali]|uniref:hypothetical protein n=1 Tax=Mesobacillus jeotgali TaxID=129985 RepID=UPI0009A719F8|nr:hypothetical protein [Mesobacillus jeotgali]